MAPPDNLKDLFFSFNNLSSCNLSSMVEQLSESVGDIYFPWVAVYLVEHAYIELNLHTLYLHFWTIWLIDLLTLEESYRHIGLAFTADLSFNLSFDRVILKNLIVIGWACRLVKGVPVSADAVPLSDIVITASCTGPQDLLFLL